jgi:hypothetical protein
LKNKEEHLKCCWQCDPLGNASCHSCGYVFANVHEPNRRESLSALAVPTKKRWMGELEYKLERCISGEISENLR